MDITKIILLLVEFALFNVIFVSAVLINAYLVLVTLLETTMEELVIVNTDITNKTKNSVENVTSNVELVMDQLPTVPLVLTPPEKKTLLVPVKMDSIK